MQPGDIVRIEGLAQHGVIIGGIRPDKVTVAGRGPVPEATAIEPADLGAGRFHYRRVTIEGVVRRVDPAGDAAYSTVVTYWIRPAIDVALRSITDEQGIVGAGEWKAWWKACKP